jgi:uncharacterized protein (DUF433 family)
MRRYNRANPNAIGPSAYTVKTMTIEETLKPVAPPLQLYDGKTLRVTGTRIPLERIVYAYEHGQSPEEIITHFPTLILADVYAVIAHYLYVRQQEADADLIEQEVRAASASDDFRQRLLERRARKP